MNDSAAIGDEVRKSLSAAGFTVKAASERAGLSYRTVLRYVKGERDMPVSVLLALMRASGADLVDLAGRLQPLIMAKQSSPASGPGLSSSAVLPDVGSAVLVKAGQHFEREMRELGIQSVSLHAVGTVEHDELRGAAAVIAEIVKELRNQQK
ncbi:hypothetical protein B7R21_18500 [Subtercola boreus]|uniref:HTH cro/C1-type domain-containing protein n=1 Tax=Subtercola boreus TaxID=120213 RepID=A0A3E0VAV7_9MICO|nr:helix-turn-helix transcriptional regulator [Subtercola boreus]RFA06765.1 hypothetical protein B7R21_18500 [Subtercola boreus]